MLCLFYKTSVLLLMFGVAFSYHSTKECQCGYGGLCVTRWLKLDNSVCRLCDRMSGGFYKDCSEIRDHCESSPCQNSGFCRQTFGSFYCECSDGYFGQRCEVHEPSFKKLGISSEVRAYHQLQPEPDGTNIFHVVYDPGDPDELRKQGFEVRINVTLSDGRMFFPVRGKQIHLNDTHVLCHNDAVRDTALYDGRICKLVPRGKSWTFTIDVTNYYGYLNRTTSDFIRTGPSNFVVGVAGALQVSVELRNLSSGLNYLLYDQTYNYFDYKLYRRAHNCLEKMSFYGCSYDKEAPALYTRGHALKITAVRNKRQCQGALSVRLEWHIQRNLEHHVQYEYDPVPVMYEQLENQQFAIIPRRTLDPGLHMLLYSEVLRGNPPNFGSTREFRISGRCWVRVVISAPLMRVPSGAEFYAFCQKRLTLPILLRDSAYVVTDFKYSGKCDHTDDPECARCPVQGNAVVKIDTPCNTTYNFTIFVHRIMDPAEFKIHAIVHFHDSEINLIIACIYNCLPIDVGRRVILRAFFRPYAPAVVKWSSFLENSLVNGSDGEFDIFTDSSSSRVLRVNGDRFKRSGQPSSNVLFRVEKRTSVSEPLVLVTSYETISVDLTVLVKLFHLEDYGNGTYFFNFTSAREAVYKPIRYRVYSIFNKTRGLFIEISTTYKDRLRFFPSGDAVAVCMINPYFIEACTPRMPIEMRVSNRYKTSLDELELILVSGDRYNFLAGAVVFLHKNLIYNGTHIHWNMTLNERLKLLTIFQDLQMLEQHDVMMAVNFLCMYFMSEQGSVYSGMPTFVEDPEINSDYHKGVTWMMIRYEAQNALKATAQFFSDYINPTNFRVLISPEGTALGMMVRAWALSYLQGNLVVTNNDEWLLGEQAYWGMNTFREVEKLSTLIGEVVSKLVVPYYGLRLFGLQYVRIYQVSTTYVGILRLLDRSQPPSENWPRYTDYLFGPPNKTNETWWDTMDLKFPEIGWNYTHSFSLVVFVAENRVGFGSFAITPILYMELRMDKGGPLNTLPDQRPFFITFPLQTTKEKYAIFFEKHSIVQPTRKTPNTAWRYLFAIKSILPVTFEDYWVVIIKQYNYAAGGEWILKAKIFVDSQPDPEDMVDAEPLTGNFSSDLTTSTSTIRVYPRKGETGVPRVYYLGFILDDSVKPGSYVFGVPYYVPVCEVDPSRSAGTHICKGVQTNSSGTVDLMKIRCACTHFGTTYAVFRPIRRVQLFYEPITLIFPASGTLAIVCCAAVMTCALLLLVMAVIFDVKRVKTSPYNYVEDAFPADKYMLLVGVYTGMPLFAGSRSHIAIKLMGSKASSRVHILNIKRKKAFRWMNDDWFVIPVNKPLGNITDVCMWHDFNCASDWYCSRVIIFDIEASVWYFADVERWFKLYSDDETSQMVQLQVGEMDEMREEMDIVRETYLGYYVRELQNTHIPLSAFTIHSRYIGFYEHKCVVFLVKLFGLFFFSWVLQGIGFKTVFRNYDHTQRRLTRVSDNTLPMLFFIILLSRGFSFPCSSVYRLYVRSRNVQFKTTNPLIFMDLRRRSRSVSRRPSHTSTGGRDPKMNFPPKAKSQSPESIMGVTFRKLSSSRSNKIAGGSNRSSQRTNVPLKMKSQSPAESVLERATSGNVPLHTSSKITVGSNRSRTNVPLKMKSQSPADSVSERVTFGNAPSNTSNKIAVGSNRSNLKTLSGRSSSFARRKSPGRTSRKSTLKSIASLGYRSDRLRLLSFIFGPSQFRSVNAEMDYFRTRMQLQIGARCVVGLILLSLCTFFLYAEIFTDHWLMYRQSCFLVMMGVLLDALVFEPVIIFFKTLAAYSVFQFSHAEKYFYDENIELDEDEHESLSYVQYVEQVTKSSYMPLSSVQLVEKRSGQKTLRMALLSLFYICVLISAFNAYYQISWASRTSLWASRRTVKDAFTGSVQVHGVPGAALTEVADHNSFMSYITTNFVTMNSTWSSLKNISSNGMKWGKDRYSVPIGAVNVIVQFIQGPRNNRWLGNIQNYQDLLINDQEPRLGFQPLNKEPIILDNIERYFKVTYSSESIRGKSSQLYSFEGHTWEIPFHPWVKFFATLRSDVEDLLDDETVGAGQLQALILSSTFWIPNLPALMTVDVIFEDRMDGTHQALVQIQNSQVFYYSGRFEEKYPSLASRLVNSCLFFCIFFGNIFILSKVGITAYFTTYRWVISILYLLALFLNGLSSAFWYYFKFKSVEAVVNKPTDVYTDVHRIYLFSDTIDGAIACFMFLMSLLEVLMVLQWAFRMKRLELSKASCCRVAFTLTMLLAFAFQLYFVTHLTGVWSDARVYPLMPTMMSGNFLPPSEADKWFWDIYFFILLVPLIVFKKACSACIMKVYLSFKLPEHPEKFAHPIKTKYLPEHIQRVKSMSVTAVSRSPTIRLGSSVRLSTPLEMNSLSLIRPSSRNMAIDKPISYVEAIRNGARRKTHTFAVPSGPIPDRVDICITDYFSPSPPVESRSKKSSKNSDKSDEARQKVGENTTKKFLWFF